ncbi:hypothetical protein ONE63_006488 [Megalurothrips usitatus]|uniref:Mapk-regulated corepressor-interacting protein 1 n=1 Tax=Megalurothrips usitatus TaxID=439358 RepID=A0AAV7XWY2_9NEOP|nr:hypothetical protein ONE63_006488 [Megalurothrips usitatus]
MNQMQSVNGKRPVQATRFRDERPQTAQQDELIRFIYESWHKVSREVEHYSQNGAENGKGGSLVYYYCDNEPNPVLKDFQPFDLEDWCRKRLVTTNRNQPSS